MRILILPGLGWSKENDLSDKPRPSHKASVAICLCTDLLCDGAEGFLIWKCSAKRQAPATKRALQHRDCVCIMVRYSASMAHRLVPPFL